MSINRFLMIAATTILLAITTPMIAQDFELTWYSIDGGGEIFSAGGAFELGGTVGQHDAGPETGPMIGGAFELVGGFWASASTDCSCPGDLTGDHVIDGNDIQQMADCFLTPDGACSCADVDGIGGLSMNDVAVFVGDLLTGTGCQ